MAMTLRMRKRWVRPLGTGWIKWVSLGGEARWDEMKSLTVAVVVQIDELILPLGDDSEGVFEEGDDDEEAAEVREVAGVWG